MKKNIDIKVPSSWTDLSDQQLSYIFRLIAEDYSLTEIKTHALLRFGNLRVVGRIPEPSKNYILRLSYRRGAHLHPRSTFFEASPEDIARILSPLDFLDDFSPVPVRISRIGSHRALPVDFQEVPFQTYIIADNLYQGYLFTRDDALLLQLAEVLYNCDNPRLKPYHLISIFYWMASLKIYLSSRFKDFFQPLPASNQLGSDGTPAPAQVQQAMDAQIRALTKGDPTKEAAVLALDTWRALTELNAQAREYAEMKQSLKK